MSFPVLLEQDRHGFLAERWFHNIDKQTDVDRRYAICNWGRHQVESNKANSGWRHKGDSRRTEKFNEHLVRYFQLYH